MLREPLLHFLLLGAVLFAVYGRVGARSPDAGAPGDIVVTQGRVRSLAETFARTWQRPPTADELDGLVQDFIREEVLYREALALGLERDDTIVRRRLRQKYEFLLEDHLVAASGPSDRELEDLVQNDPGRYRVDSRFDLEQVFLDPGRRGDGIEADAARLLAALRGRGGRVDPETAGDPLMLGFRFDDLTETDAAQMFGREFAAALARQPAGEWSGPLRSGYGMHLVRVEVATPGRVPEPSRVRAAALRDWSDRKRREMLEARYQALRARHRITVEAPSGR